MILFFRLNIQELPTLILYKDGKPVTYGGAPNSQAIVAYLTVAAQ